MTPGDDCPKCGEALCRVSRCSDRDGIRNDRWCEGCRTMFACYAHGLGVKYVLKDEYTGTAKQRIAGLLRSALAELGEP